MNIEGYFPGKPSTPFSLQLSEMPGYRKPDYNKFIDGTKTAVIYPLLSTVPRQNGILVSLSGGADSCTAAVVCRDAVEQYGRGMSLQCITFGTEYENKMGQTDIGNAWRFCAEKSIDHKYIALDELLSSWERTQPASLPIVKIDSIARLRSIMARRQADEKNLLLSGTGNYSEWLAREFSGGLSGSHFSFLHLLYKTEVIELGRHIGVPGYVLEKDSGASEVGLTVRDLYGVNYTDGLDAVLYLFDSGRTAEEISRQFGIDPEWLNRVQERMKNHDWRISCLGLEDCPRI